MKPRDIFGIILRTVAVYLCIYGAWYTLAGISYIPATLIDAISGRGERHNAFGWFIYGVPAFICGVLILRFAEGLVRFTYRIEAPQPPPSPSAPAPSKVAADL